jgi:hypothetical protein
MPLHKTKLKTATMPITKKNVQFHGTVEVKRISGRLEDITKEEYDGLWYCADEYTRMREREQRLVRRFSSKRDAVWLESETGLESKEQKYKRRLRVDTGKRSVLMEQERQWEKDDCNLALLAQMCEECSRESAEQASIRGRKNAIESYHDRMLGRENTFAMEMPCPNRWDLSCLHSDLTMHRESVSRIARLKPPQ